MLWANKIRRATIFKFFDYSKVLNPNTDIMEFAISFHFITTIGIIATILFFNHYCRNQPQHQINLRP